MNEAFFMEDGDTLNINWQQSRYDDPKQFALRIIVLYTYCGSLALLVAALYHFMMSVPFLSSLAGFGSNSLVVTILFLICVGIAPEVVKSLLIFSMWMGWVKTARLKLFLFEMLFLWEWLFRFIFIFVAIFSVPSNLKDSSNTLNSFFVK